MQCWQALQMTNLKLLTTNTLTGNSRQITKVILRSIRWNFQLVYISSFIHDPFVFVCVCFDRVFFEVAKIPLVHTDTLEEALTVH